jgi:AcrR family transcriptional regulator
MNAQLDILPAVAPRPYGGVPAAERHAQRRERLIEAAYDVFGREGYRNATMRLVCAQARLTERYFYEHFANIDEVFLAVHKKVSAEVGGEIMTRVMTASEEPVEQTRAGLAAFFEFIKADPRRAQILLLDAVTTGLTNPRNLSAKVSQYAELLRVRFKKRYPNLTIPVDVELVVGGFVGMIIHTASVWTERGFDTPVDTLVDHNVYAWIGLHEWLGRHSSTAATTTDTTALPGA